MAAPGKQYGLILPKKLLQRPAFLPKHSAFADDSDEESTVGSRLQKEALKKKVMKQTKLEMQKALEQDSTVYEYDSVYDELQRKKEENSTAQKLVVKEKKPKYIQSLLQAVEVRKKEQEKRMEKKIQKEREAEGAEFEDKEAFVTSAYKKKLEERAEEEDQEKRDAAIEASLDVTKQKDLSGFYRHLLNQSVGEEQAPECSLRDSRVKDEKPKGYSDESTLPDQSSNEKNKPKVTVKEEILDANIDLQSTKNKEEEKVEPPKVEPPMEEPQKEEPPKEEQPKDGQALPDKKEARDSSASSEESSKGQLSQRQSRSPSEEKSAHRSDKHSQKESKKSHKKDKGEGGSSSKKERHKERDQEKKDRDKEKGERHRHSDHGSKSDHRKRDDPEGRSRTKDKKPEKDRKRDKDRDDKHSERERQRNGKEEKEKERGEKHRDREEEKKERAEKDRKKRGEQKDGSPPPLRKERDSVGEGEKTKEKESVQDIEKMEKESVQDIEKMEKESVQELDKLADKESVGEGDKMEESEGGGKAPEGSHSPPPEGLPELKRKVTEEGEADGAGQTEDSAENKNKFAKRSNEETLLSARDRYLARQMARVSTKAYIEKEED